MAAYVKRTQRRMGTLTSRSSLYMMLYLATVKFRQNFKGWSSDYAGNHHARHVRAGRLRASFLLHRRNEGRGRGIPLGKPIPTRCSIPSPIPCSRRSIDLGTSCTRRSRTRYSSLSSKRSTHSMKRTAPSGAPMRLGSWAITCSIRPCIRSCTSTSSSCAMRASRAFRARTATRCTLSSRASTTRWCSR